MKKISTIPNRAEQVYVAIRDSICEGRLKAGTHLVQENLAARLGVSRQPVQQAMALLKNDGLVLEQGARGLYVAPLDALATRHRYQIRMGLDQLAARLIAGRAAASPEFAEDFLHEGRLILAEGHKAVTAGNHVAAVAADVAFHSFLYEQSGNPMIAPTAETLWHYLRRVMISVLTYAERGRTVWEQHGEILEALARGDVDRGVELVTIHIQGAESALFGREGELRSEPEDMPETG